MKFNQNAAIRGALRRVFSRSPVVREVLMEVRREVPRYNKDKSRSKKDAVEYRCAVCNEFASSTKISVDHIIPVISTDKGFTDWNMFIDRLFCSKKELQPICHTCHKRKTNAERLERNKVKDLAELMSTLQTKSAFLVTSQGRSYLRKYTKKTKHPEVIAFARDLLGKL